MRQRRDDGAAVDRTGPRTGVDQRSQQPLDALEIGATAPDLGEMALGDDEDLLATAASPASHAEQLANSRRGEAEQQRAVYQGDAVDLFRGIEQQAVGPPRPGQQS